MTNQNNAAQAAEQAIKAAIRKAYDDGYNDAKMAPDNCSTYSVERAVRLDSAALLSKLRAPVADPLPLSQYRHQDLFEAIGKAVTAPYRGPFEISVKAFRDALASAPAADTLPLEKVLHELVSKIAPGLDTGDILQDARQASAMLGSTMASAPVADERAAQGYGSPADVAQRIEQYLYHDGRKNSATQLLYEAMKALRNSTLLPVSVDIRRMAERIAADKFEHYTADPIFTVQRRRVWAGFDLVYEPKIGWFCDGEQVTGAERDALEAEYQESGKVPSDRTRTGIMEMWEHHATYMTMEAAQEFVAKKGDEYRVYVDSGCRNHEWQALRAFLLQIAALQGKGGEA